MKIEEAIVYCLATSNRGMRSEQIADMFCFNLGRIMLMI